MPDRYFLETPPHGKQAELSGPEAHHLAHVMRAAVGDQVLLFDGSGIEFTAEIRKIGRQNVELAVISQAVIDREPPRPVVIGVSLPKGDRQKWLVEKLVELGATELIPLTTRRSVAQPVDSALARLQRQVLEATKQCGRTKLMAIGEPCAWQEFINKPPAGAARWLAHTAFDQAAKPTDVRQQLTSAGVWFAIGPEGGFTDDEVAGAIAHGWQAVSFGPRVLRVETAAIAAVVCAVE